VETKVIIHECAKCKNFILPDDGYEKRYKFFSKGNLEVRRYYFMVCEQCALGGKDGFTEQTDQ